MDIIGWRFLLQICRRVLRGRQVVTIPASLTSVTAHGLSWLGCIIFCKVTQHIKSSLIYDLPPPL
jgi:hypothetical protein